MHRVTYIAVKLYQIGFVQGYKLRARPVKMDSMYLQKIWQAACVNIKNTSMMYNYDGLQKYYISREVFSVDVMLFFFLSW